MIKKPVTNAVMQQLGGYCLPPLDASGASLVTVSRGEYLLREGESMDSLYLLLQGTASVCIGVSNGRKMQLCRFVSEGMIGDVELATGRHIALATMRALSELTLVGLPYREYEKVLKGDLAFMNYMAKGLAHKLIQSDTNGAVTVLHSAESRICAYILQTAREGVFCENLTDVAELTGTSYRHLMRCLGTLRREGILFPHPGGGSVIQNERALRERAGDSYLTELPGESPECRRKNAFLHKI